MSSKNMPWNTGTSGHHARMCLLYLDIMLPQVNENLRFLYTMFEMKIGEGYYNPPQILF
jgi:hypothetical protein